MPMSDGVFVCIMFVVFLLLGFFLGALVTTLMIEDEERRITMSYIKDLLIGAAERYASENDVDFEDAMNKIVEGEALQDMDLLEVYAYANNTEVQHF